MPEPPSASQWELADSAYQTHHFSCPHCVAAGITRAQERCQAGTALWQAYQQERDPRAQQKKLGVKQHEQYRPARQAGPGDTHYAVDGQHIADPVHTERHAPDASGVRGTPGRTPQYAGRQAGK